MATATKPSSTSSSNGTAVSTVTDAARSAKGPVVAAGAAAAGLVGGVALGSRLRTGRRPLVRPRPRLLGVPLGRKSGLHWTVETLGKAAKELGSATKQVSSTTDDIHKVREELEQANRQSPVEVLLSALTHRRGAHRREN